LAKLHTEKTCRTAVGQLSRRLATDASICNRLSAKHVVNCLKSLGDMEDDPACRSAAVRLAQRLLMDSVLVAQLSNEAVSDCLTALSKLQNEAACRDAVTRLLHRVSASEAPHEGLDAAVMQRSFS